MTSKPLRDRIQRLKREYDTLRSGKGSLLVLLEEAEVAESVYNSNAIENSTLTLKETEKILLDLEVSRDVSVREVFEAKNLARVMAFVREKVSDTELSKELILLLHEMLLTGINDHIAGRFRGSHEFVRVGSHVAPAPEHVERMLEDILSKYASDHEVYDPDKIAHFHLGFETVHPFNDGNGRIGRVIMNYQLKRLGYPPIIIRDKEKQLYYNAFLEYRDGPRHAKLMEKVLALALMESLHKRVAYLASASITTLSDFATQSSRELITLSNAARRKTIPAFREKGVWKIRTDYQPDSE